MNVFDVEVGPKFFDTLGVPLLLGRTISPRDTPASPLVTVVNETLAKRYFAGQNPIGRRLSLGSPFAAPGVEIIGVVGDSKYYSASEKPEPMAFFSAWQPGRLGSLLRRTTDYEPLTIRMELRPKYTDDPRGR